MLECLYPRHCPVCEKVILPKERACKACYKKIRFVTGPTCFQCGKPIDREEQEYCGDCVRYKKTFAKGFVLMEYDDVTRPSITAFKYHNARDYKDFYIKEIEERLGDVLCSLDLDGLIPVPVHAKKKRMRGYNQAQVLTHGLSKALHIPEYPTYLVRDMYTTPLKELGPMDRLKNLR